MAIIITDPFITRWLSSLYKGKDSLGLPIISQQTSKILGKVTDILCSPTLQEIECLLVTDKNSNEGKQCVPSCISSLGRDAIIVNTDELPSHDEIQEEKIFLSKLKGTHIVCSDGTKIGEVVDILFELPREIWGLEVSEGFIGDLLTGRHTINRDAVKKISEDCILVDF